MPQYQQLLLLFLYTLPVILFVVYRKKQRIGFFFYLFCFVYILLLSLRPETIGSDTSNYIASFESKTYLITESYEISWVGICFIIDNLFHLDIRFVFLVYALITVLPIIYVCYKDSSYPYMSILFFIMMFGLMPFNIMRHCAAMSLSLLVIHFFSKKKLFKACLFGGLAILFHNSAVVLVIFGIAIIFFQRFNLSNNMLILILWITLILGYVSFSLSSSIIGMFPTDKFSAYSDYALERGVSINNIFIMNIITLCWGSIFLRFQSMKSKNLYYWTYFVSFLMNNFLSYQIGANRVLFFISIASIIYIPNLIINEKKNIKIVRVVTYYSIFVFIMFIRSVFLNGDGVNP